MRHAVVVGAALVLVGGLAPVMSPVRAEATAVTADDAVLAFDFDGDGYVDLAVGVPGEGLRGRRDAGAVQVLYGSPSGPTARDQLWHQGRKGVKGAVESRDMFGYVRASGDFDADGFADLAIGIPGEDLGAVQDAGAVQVLYGSSRGLTARDQVWHQGRSGIPGSNERADFWGSRLAVGDFDGDGFADLAIGSIGEGIGNAQRAGAVTVLRGSSSGLAAAGARSIRQGKDGLPGQPEEHEGFGTSLLAGDVNGDGRDDLVIKVQRTGSPWNSWSGPGEEPVPAVHVLLGAASGLVVPGSQYFTAPDLGLPPAMNGGQTLSDFNRDGFADLALAAFVFPGGSVRVAVLHGHVDGLHPAPLPDAGTPGVEDAVWSIPSALLGSADEAAQNLVSGDLTGDGNADLAVAQGPTVEVILGTGRGLGTTSLSWEVGSWSRYIAALPLSGGSHDWLVVGDHNATIGSDRYAGQVSVLRGTLAGQPGPMTVWHQDSPGIKGAAERQDSFGFVLG